MQPFDEAEFKVQTQNMYNHGGTANVLDCVIVMLESCLIITRKLKEIITQKEN